MSLKIILNRNVQIINHSGSEGVPDGMDSSCYVNFQGRVITITPLMREILEMCRTEHTIKELIQQLANRLECAYDDVYPAVLAFLKRMGKLEVLIPWKDFIESKYDTIEKIKAAKEFRNYKLISTLGRNNKVLIYKCQLSGGDPTFYSLKLLLEKGGYKSFLREHEMLTKLPPHKNIRKSFEASIHEGVAYILLEYIDGKSLPDITNRVSIEAKYSIASRLISAVNHLHCHDLLHGDIHASNFLVDTNYQVYLIDLGMAHHKSEKKRDHGGVPQYMPPERMPEHNMNFSKEKGNCVSEIFQVGVCLYRLFSGAYPFQGGLLKDLRNSIKNLPPPPLIQTENKEEIPEAIRHVIYKAMEKKPADRYPDMAALLTSWDAAVNEVSLAPNLLNTSYRG